MEVRLTLQKFAEIGSHGFSRVSCYGQYGSQAGNGRKWPKMAENGRKWISACFTSWSSRWPGRHRWASVSIGEHRHWAKHIKNLTPSKIRKFFLPLFWPFMRSWHFGADFGKKLELLLSWRGYRGNFRSVDGGTGATLDFRVFHVIPLLLSISHLHQHIF